MPPTTYKPEVGHHVFVYRKKDLDGVNPEEILVEGGISGKDSDGAFQVDFFDGHKSRLYESSQIFQIRKILVIERPVHASDSFRIAAGRGHTDNLRDANFAPVINPEWVNPQTHEGVQRLESLKASADVIYEVDSLGDFSNPRPLS